MSINPNDDDENPQLPYYAEPQMRPTSESESQVAPQAATAATAETRAADVLLGKGRAHNHHTGNQNFRRMVRETSDEYDAAHTYAETTRISNELVARVHQQSGRFLEFDEANRRWLVIDNERARRKATQDLRNYRRSRRKATQNLRNYRRSNMKARNAAAGATEAAAVTVFAAEAERVATAARGELRRRPSASSALHDAVSEDDLWLAADLPFPAHQQPIEWMRQDPLLSDEAILAALVEPSLDCRSSDNEAEEGVDSGSV